MLGIELLLGLQLFWRQSFIVSLLLLVTSNDQDWLKRKLKVAEIGENFDVSKMTKVVAGKKLWNYDALEPTEKKGAI